MDASKNPLSARLTNALRGRLVARGRFAFVALTAIVVFIAFVALAVRARAARAGEGPRAPSPASPVVAPRLPPGLADVGVDEHLGASLPLDASFRDHTGERVRLDRYFDRRRPVVINLMYHRCTMLCSVVLDALVNGLKGVAWTVGKEFDVVSISIDPRDGAALGAHARERILARYGRADAAHGWHFLTGEQADIDRVAGALGFRYHWVPEEEQYAHPAAIFVLTPDGKIARYLYGIDFAPADLRLGLLEASEGKSVSTVERVLLFCYHYDATGRRYTFMVTRVLRVGGLVVLVAVAALIGTLWRRERRASRSPPRA
jgi:protein SCO1/2